MLLLLLGTSVRMDTGGRLDGVTLPRREGEGEVGVREGEGDDLLIEKLRREEVEGEADVEDDVDAAGVAS